MGGVNQVFNISHSMYYELEIIFSERSSCFALGPYILSAGAFFSKGEREEKIKFVTYNAFVSHLLEFCSSLGGEGPIS